MAARAHRARVLPSVEKHCRPEGGGTRDADPGMNLRETTNAATHIITWNAVSADLLQ